MATEEKALIPKNYKQHPEKNALLELLTEWIVRELGHLVSQYVWPHPYCEDACGCKILANFHTLTCGNWVQGLCYNQCGNCPRIYFSIDYMDGFSHLGADVQRYCPRCIFHRCEICGVDVVQSNYVAHMTTHDLKSTEDIPTQLEIMRDEQKILEDLAFARLAEVNVRLWRAGVVRPRHPIKMLPPPVVDEVLDEGWEDSTDDSIDPGEV